MLKLEIHQKAAASFNEKAKLLLAKLQTPPVRTEKPCSFKPESFIAHNITGADIIGIPKTGLIDPSGKQLARYFQDNGRQIGLYGSDFEDAMKLAESFQNCKELAPLVSQGFILDQIFDWIEQSHKGTSALSLVDYVLKECSTLIKNVNIWIPISGLHIQSPLTIGRVILKPITKAMFDSWAATVSAKPSSQTNDILEWLKRERKQLQGLAASTMELFAEPDRAREIAFEETEKAVGLLRFFEGTNFEPDMVSYCAPLGHRPPAFRKHFTLDAGMLGKSEQHLTEHSKDWILSDTDIAELNRDGLQILSGLVAIDHQLSEFEERLIGALLIYSRNGLERLPTGKLIYILSALESILLKDSTEGIEQNLGERMAFITGRDVPGRKAIIANIKEVYHLRSQFLHHGITIQNLAAMRTFMRNAWILLHVLVRNTTKVKTMQGFFDSIEKIKLS